MLCLYTKVKLIKHIMQLTVMDKLFWHLKDRNIIHIEV